MDPIIAFLIGSVGSAIVGGATSLFQSGMNVNAQQDINSQNLAITKEINQQNIENQWKMWQATNEYNTPSAQLSRFAAAGLNPNLIYGQQNTTNPVSIPSMQRPDLKAPQYDLSGLKEAVEKLIEIPFVKEKYRQERIKTNIMADEAEILGADAAEANVRNAQAATVLANLDGYLKSYYDGLIAQSNSYAIKNELMRKQAATEEAIKNLKDLEHKYKAGFDDFPGFYELQRVAMELANSLKGIDVDWKQLEKSIGASNGIAKFVLTMVKLFFGQ